MQQVDTNKSKPQKAVTISPELVKQVSEKVYELWRREMAIARERQRRR